ELKLDDKLNFVGEPVEIMDQEIKQLRQSRIPIIEKNKHDLDTMSFDDLYNNFKIVEQEVKGTASSSSSSQKMAFVSSPSSTNEVNTAYGISTASTQVSTVSTQVRFANLSDATIYAFLADPPNGSQLVHEDLVQIHKDDLEEMDLKWQLALLSMWTRRECKGTKSQDSMNRNQDSSRRTVNVEETSSKAMVAIDGAGIFLPLKLDLSNSGLEEFKQPEFEGYGPKTSKSVSEDISNEFKESPDAPLVKELVSDDKGYVTFREGAKGGKVTDKGTLKTDGLLFDSSSKNASNDEPQPYSDAGKKDDEGVSKESGIDDQKKAKTDREKKGKVKIVTEASVRRHLKLADSDCISSLPTTEIFEQLSLMGNMKRASKSYTGENIPLFPTMIVQGPVVQGEGSTHPVESHHTPTSAPSTSQPPVSPTFKRTTRHESMVPQPRSPTQSPVTDETASTGVDVKYGGATTTVTGLKAGHGSSNIDKTPTMPHDLPFTRVNTLGSNEGSMTQQELMVFCMTLSKKVESLETDLKQTKQIYNAADTKLIKKVKKLEKTAKSSKAKRRARIVVSDDEDDLEDPSKQGRKITEIDQDPSISLVQHDAKMQGRYGHDMEFDYDFDTAEKDVSTTEPVSTGGAAVTTDSVSVSTPSPTRNTGVSTTYDITMVETLVYIRKSAAKDKASSFNIEEWEDIQARVEADEELVQRVQQRKEINTLKLNKQECLQSLSIRERDDELSQEELQQMMIIVPEQWMNVKSLPTKDDLVMMWSLVKEKFNSTELTDDKQREIWVKGHHVSTEKGIDIYMLVEKEYPLSRGTLTLMLVAKLLVDQYNEMSRELLRKIFMHAERPRR
nr:hypothetical protein [Tanacetum cinerariifolium]